MGDLRRVVVVVVALSIAATLIAAIAGRRAHDEPGPWQDAQDRCRADGGEVVGDDLAWYCRGGQAP